MKPPLTRAGELIDSPSPVSRQKFVYVVNFSMGHAVGILISNGQYSNFHIKQFSGVFLQCQKRIVNHNVKKLIKESQ